MAINNIRTVNSNAADITDNCMMSVSDLGEIKNDIQVIHTLGLSHIIATDLNTMISVVGEINDNQEELEKKLDEYKKYVQNDDMDTYNSLVSNYNTMKYELGNIMAYSALGKNEEAYATNYMENVVAEVDGSVVKSNDSASDLSAMTEELSATMQDVGLSVNTINDNADNILKDVEIIATKSDDINQFSKEMKANAEK